MGKTLVLNSKANIVENDKILFMSKDSYSLNKLKQIVKENNYNVAQLSNITFVHRDIIKRYLAGTRINHIDYEKIIKCFPELTETNNNKLTLKPILVTGALTKSGVVRHLYINEPKQFLFLECAQSLFGKNLVAILSNHSNNIILCKLTENKNFYQADNEKNEYFIVTDRNCYYGINLNLNGNWTLCNFLTYEKIEWEEDEKVVEVYQTFLKVNSNWNLFIEKKEKKVK